MDEVSARVRLAEEAAPSALAVTVPRSEVEEAISAEVEADLVLDVVRTNGEREERRVAIAWDQKALERLLAETDSERVTIAIDPEALAAAFEADVEAHGLREVGATLAIAVTALGGAGSAVAGNVEGSQPFASDVPAVAATVEQGMPRAMPADYAAAETQMPRAMPSDYAAADVSDVTLRRDPGAMPTGPATTQAVDRGIENVRAAQPAPAATPDPSQAIENVRSGGAAVPDPSTGIENVRAERVPAQTGDGGATISAPSTTVTAALAGGVALTIVAAAFALRRRREPQPAT
jgi:MYXO-CTERM domain-containing protein